MNKRKLRYRIAVPVDHEYVLSFARDEFTANIDLGTQSMPSINPEDIYNNMMRFNKKLIHDIDDLSHQETLKVSSHPDKCKQTPWADKTFDQIKNMNKRKIRDRIAVPMDHEYVLSFARDEFTANIDLGPQSMPSINPEDIYNNMMRFNKKLIHDLDDLSHQETLEVSSLFDQCEQAIKFEVLSDAKTDAFILPDQCELAPKLEVVDDKESLKPALFADQREWTSQFEYLSDAKTAFSLPDQCEHKPWVDELFDQVTPEACQILHNCGEIPQLSDQTISKTFHKQASVNDDSYTRFGLYIGDELRKYDAKTLEHVKKDIYRVIRKADTRSRKRHGKLD